MLCTLMCTSRFCFPWSFVVSAFFIGFSFVGQSFFLVWFMCLFGVASVSGSYFLTFCTFSSDQPSKFPALMAFSYVDLTGYPHTVCIHLIAFLVDGKLYTMMSSSILWIALFVGFRDVQLWLCGITGTQYRPDLSCFPRRKALPWHVMSTSSSLMTTALLFVKININPLSANHCKISRFSQKMGIILEHNPKYLTSI